MSQPPWLRIHGARQNNLKNVSVEIPHDRVTVVTGVSGSGKSSLAFDTLFAEGQWRYIESLSTYARMFLERIDRPDVDLDRAHPSRDRARAEEPGAHRPLDGGHRHRAARLPAPALREDRPRPLPDLRGRARSDSRGPGGRRPARASTRGRAR